MKRLLFLLLMAATCHAQDTVTLKHSCYVSHFVKSAHIPWYVEYDLTKDELACKSKIVRTNKFVADPECPTATNLKKDYQASGYDQGHNMSAEDNTCDAAAMDECFYFSNMFPQTPKLNRGIWKMLENEERKEATTEGKIHVYIGSYGVAKKLGPDKVVVPDFCWKVIYHYSTHTYDAYIFPNNDTVTGDPEDFKTGIKDIEKRSGIHFSE